MKKLYLIILLAIFFTFISANFCLSQRELEVEYPEVMGIKPKLTKTALPDYIRYIFNFVIMIGGLIAFLMIIIGGIRWMYSGLNPAALADAKDQIFSALLGLALLIGSFLILNTINPQLTVISPEVPSVAQIGLKLKGSVPLKDPVTGQPLIDPLTGEIKTEEETRIYHGSVEDFKDFKPKEFEFLGSYGGKPAKEQLWVKFYSQPFFKENVWEIEEGVESGIIPSTFDAKSMSIDLRVPGVKLCQRENLKICRWYYTNTDKLDEEIGRKLSFERWSGKRGEIYIKNLPKEKLIGAVIHGNRGFEGGCEVFLPNLNNPYSPFYTINTFPIPEIEGGGDSVTLFRYSPEIGQGKIVLYGEVGFKGEWKYEMNEEEIKELLKCEEGKKGCEKCWFDSKVCEKKTPPPEGFYFSLPRLKVEDKVSAADRALGRVRVNTLGQVQIKSIEIDGNFLLVAWNARNGQCEIFDRSDPHLYDNHISKGPGWGWIDEITVIPIEPIPKEL